MPRYRSKKTGRYVSAYYAKRHPKTTEIVEADVKEQKSEAADFAERYIEEYPDTFRELARR